MNRTYKSNNGKIITDTLDRPMKLNVDMRYIIEERDREIKEKDEQIKLLQTFDRQFRLEKYKEGMSLTSAQTVGCMIFLLVFGFVLGRVL